ncbi:MAG: hypothetical protein JF888_10685 [Candidatus Dormibacteraeota bacterium]|uniref:Uncharacterized protein n=1 Tax=Candidatus Dormiibacter inghamiae TaxID=3127013 RepID=A0A934KBX0_9BACT|nr:hypothetical protein [Candidatus Dormibacteraeota bacterium]MBJ7607339.1 hypothetical protein [Candidatus Dormibacteraeota bacterium]
MTFLIDPPRELEVRTDAAGYPRWLQADPLIGEVEPVQRWLAELDWWSRPVSREYWKVLLGGQLLCEIYRDLEAGGWFVERVYD